MAEATAAKPAGVQVLSVKDLQAWYGESHILHGINFDVNAGEVVTLLGRNGAGKTTTLKSIMGIIGKRTGSIRFDNQEIIRASSDKIARMGIAFCPEERGIFASLDVRENLLLPPIVRSGGLSLDQIFDLFPEPEGTPEQPGHETFRRRAADAGDRPDPAHRRSLPDAGRTDRRPGAGHHPADRPHHRAAEEGGFHDPAGRTEFPFRLYRCRPLLHRRARQGDRRFRQSDLQANMDKLHTYLGV